MFVKCPLEYSTESSRLLRVHPLQWSSMIVLWFKWVCQLEWNRGFDPSLVIEAVFVYPKLKRQEKHISADCMEMSDLQGLE